MNHGKIVTLLAAALLAAALSGCGTSKPNAGEPFGGKSNGGQTDVLASAPEQVQSLYKNNCLSCHGSGLEGKVGPKTNLQKVGGQMTREQITKQVTGGGNGMPGFGGKLKPEEIDALAGWLAEKK
ncbi:c-type cytochrome [Paenibacillus piri]|uniref:Cytochrome c n=1 Tax=Paenibacillus piri TaxID=2547395 RepID=A0A4R5KQF1_9BACL|nr:cytochrome c [Paenibacillus piri]TDF97235.1 cytochrome c [Paenibacillus piri]